MDSLNTLFIYYLGIIFIGYLAKKFKVLKVEDGHTLTNLILYITFPAVVLKTFNNVHINSSMVMICIISILFGLLMTVISIIVFKKRNILHQKGLLISSCLGFNIGLFAYPFVQGIWGYKGLIYIAMFDLGNALIVYGVSYILAIYYSPKNIQFAIMDIVKRLLKFVPLQCYIVAIIINQLNIVFSPSVNKFLSTIAAANTPLVLILLGLFLSFKIDKNYFANTSKVLLLRYVIGFALGLILFFVVPGDMMVKTSLLLGLVMPVGVIVIPYSLFFKYDAKLAGTIVNISNILSFAFIWGIASCLLH
ncbi:MAG: hypothetical protein GY756_18470 [bacterium]|nr:hypothetical protein [bacterium]